MIDRLMEVGRPDKLGFLYSLQAQRQFKNNFS